MPPGQDLVPSFIWAPELWPSAAVPLQRHLKLAAYEGELIGLVQVVSIDDLIYGAVDS